MAENVELGGIMKDTSCAYCMIGDVFAMNPGRVTLTDEEYAELAEKIKANL